MGRKRYIDGVLVPDLPFPMPMPMCTTPPGLAATAPMALSSPGSMPGPVPMPLPLPSALAPPTMGGGMPGGQLVAGSMPALGGHQFAPGNPYLVGLPGFDPGIPQMGAFPGGFPGGILAGMPGMPGMPTMPGMIGMPGLALPGPPAGAPPPLGLPLIGVPPPAAPPGPPGKHVITQDSWRVLKIEPEVQDLADHFGLDERITGKLQEALNLRTDPGSDLEVLWEILEEARNPPGLTMIKVKEMIEGTFRAGEKTDDAVKELKEKFKLDERAAYKLSEVLATKPNRVEVLKALHTHLAASNNPSALVMLKLADLRRDVPLGDVPYGSKGYRDRPYMGNYDKDGNKVGGGKDRGKGAGDRGVSERNSGGDRPRDERGSGGDRRDDRGGDRRGGDKRRSRSRRRSRSKRRSRSRKRSRSRSRRRSRSRS